MIKFNQNARRKPFINMNTKLRIKSKNNFGKDFFKLKNNAVFGETMENVGKHRNVKRLTEEEEILFRKRRNYNYRKEII